MSSIPALITLIVLAAVLTAAVTLVRQSRALSRAETTRTRPIDVRQRQAPPSTPPGGAQFPGGTPGSAELPPRADDHLSTLSPDQQAAIITALRTELASAAQAADRKALYANLLFFTAGVVASILTTLLIHPL